MKIKNLDIKQSLQSNERFLTRGCDGRSKKEEKKINGTLFQVVCALEWMMRGLHCLSISCAGRVDQADWLRASGTSSRCSVLQRRSAEHAERPTANDSRGKFTISPYLQRRPTTLMNLQCIYSAGVRHLSNTDSGACGRGIINAHSLQHSRYIVFFATFTIHCPFNYRGTIALENPACTPICFMKPLWSKSLFPSYSQRFTNSS